jgi:two-component system sensor histidine kinase AlgZ
MKPVAEFDPTNTGPASVWPDTAEAAESVSTSFGATRFDPLAEERAQLQAQAAAAFDVCHPALALRVVLGVQVVLAILALGLAESAVDWAGRQAVLAFAGVAGSGLWLVAVCALRSPLQRLRPAPRWVFVLMLGAMAAVLAVLPLAWAALVPSGGLLAYALPLAGGAFAAAIWTWLGLRARVWHPANANARLVELQSRIRPHFLFNALNTALALVRVDPLRAELVLEDLAQLFRTALADVGTSVALDEEIELARRYLEIEQIRFGDRLQVEWEVPPADPQIAQARVPPLVLQPLVENAVRHGVEPSPTGARIRVAVASQRGQVVVTVSNTVSEEAANPGQGMALHNVRERLRLLHDLAAQCDTWREPGDSTAGEPDVFHARIVLPQG